MSNIPKCKQYWLFWYLPFIRKKTLLVARCNTIFQMPIESNPLSTFGLCVQHINSPNQICPLSLRFCIDCIYIIISVFGFKFWPWKSILHLSISFRHLLSWIKTTILGLRYFYSQLVLSKKILDIWIRDYFILLEIVDLEPLLYCNLLEKQYTHFLLVVEASTEFVLRKIDTCTVLIYLAHTLKIIFNSDMVCKVLQGINNY